MKIVRINTVKKETILTNLKRSRPDDSIKKSVIEIITEVRKNGDKALIDYNRKFDGVETTDLKVTKDEIEEAVEKAGAVYIEALKEAKEKIEQFHEKQLDSSWLKTDKEQMIGQLVGPVERAGLYVPGGSAGYPSTVLMAAIPASIAGVTDIAIASPPGKDGNISPNTIAAADVCGIDEIYKVGGAQAIAALAYGTESVAPVDVIAGPGNIYVTEAKKQVFGDVGIDLVAGPSEIVVLADIKSDPAIVASDLVSQAEHDSEASAILVTDSNVLAQKVISLIDEKLGNLSRKEEAKKSLENNGLVLIVEDAESAIEVSNIIAPEHLVVLLEQPTKWLPKIKNAGAIFLGEDAVQSAVDYSVGPNHVLPTGGAARFASPLSVGTFQKRSNIIWLGKSSLKKSADIAIVIAKSEGFDGHAQAIKERLNKN